MSPLKIEGIPEENLAVKTNNIGEQIEIKPDEFFVLSKGEVVTIPDIEKNITVKAPDSNFSIYKRPFKRVPPEHEYDSVTIVVVANGYGFYQRDSFAAYQKPPKIDGGYTLQAKDFRNPVIVWCNRQPVAKVSWQKEK